MKTPYDTALRAIGRDVDALRTSIGDAARRLAEVETRRDAVIEAMVRESRLAAGDWTFSPAPFLARSRAERDQLGEAQRAAEAEADTLRAQAMERYGSLRAMQGAADLFRDQARHAAAAAEQAGIDDVAGARSARLHRRARDKRLDARQAR